MACNCLNDQRTRLINYIESNNPDFELKPYSGIFISTAIFAKMTKAILPFEAEYTLKSKPGGRNKTYKTNLTCAYCPVCGVRYEEEEKKIDPSFEAWVNELKRIVHAESGENKFATAFTDMSVRKYFDDGLTPKQTFDKYWHV